MSIETIVAVCPTVVDTTKSPHAAMHPLPLTAVKLQDSFWQPRRETNRSVTIPSQFRQIEETARLDNFRRASGRKKDVPFVGIFFNDSDIYKWLEAAASAVAEGDPDGSLSAMIDTAIAEVAAAQEPDGYLNTYFTFDKAGERWTNLMDMHELYCAGHLFQAAVAHYRATGSDSLLTVACRFADHIDRMFGPEGKAGACGHPEAEMALVELYRATGERRYLTLAQRMVDARGQEPTAVYGPHQHDRRYRQDHIPFRDQKEMAGHAVRMVYLSAGAADIYLETGEEALLGALDHQWENRTLRRMYVTGGLGSRYEGEAFGKDYELPNERAYTETCAAIGGVMWDWRMLLATGDAGYADLMEWTLYNAVLPGISLDGQAYYYQNPLEDDGTHRRQPWFGCACCPPNVARLLAQIPGYFAGVSGDTVSLNLYAAGDITVPAAENRPEIKLSIATRYPWHGDIAVTVGTTGDYAMRLRIPGWCETGAGLLVNSEAQSVALSPGSYVEIRRSWRAGDQVRLSLAMPIRYLEAHPAVEEDRGRVAVTRGPLVYCLEQADNPGIDPHAVRLPATPDAFAAIEQPDLLQGVIVLHAEATVVEDSSWNGALYRTAAAAPSEPVSRPAALTLVPYYAWANRNSGRMAVWLRRGV